MKTIFVTLLMVFSFQFAHSEDNTLNAFTSDGCSGIGLIDEVWENIDLTDPYVDCCIEHDVAYWMGGTYNQKVAADLRLQSCTYEGINFLSYLRSLNIYIGVRLGGGPELPTPWRWGYGWSDPRPYGTLTDEEMEQILPLLPSKGMEWDFIPQEYLLNQYLQDSSN